MKGNVGGAMQLSAADRDLVGVIRMVRDRPGVMLGGKSFDRLEGFISGYLWAGKAESALLGEFSRWLRTHTGIDKEAGYAQFIRFYSLTDAGAFDAFMHDFDVFLADQESQLGGAITSE